MNKSLSTFFSDAMRPYSYSYRLSYLFMSALITILEVVFHAVSSPLSSSDILLLAGLCLLLIVVPWLGCAGDLLYVGAFIVVGAVQQASSLVFPVLGIFLITVVWIIRHQAIRAVLLLVGYVVLMFWQDGNNFPHLASDILLSVIVFALGFALKNFLDAAERSRLEMKEEVTKATASVRANLAVELHDTTARDLARISVSLESLVATHPDLSDEITPIVDLAHDSSRRLRPMIMQLNADMSVISLQNAVEESKLMLRSRKLVLNANMPEDIDCLLSKQTVITGALFVREAAANALKYAQQATPVNLFVEINDDELSLTMSNEIAKIPSSDALTGGFGLTNLKSRIESEDGRMSFISNSGRWIVNAVIPNQAKGITDE